MRRGGDAEAADALHSAGGGRPPPTVRHASPPPVARSMAPLLLIAVAVAYLHHPPWRAAPVRSRLLPSTLAVAVD